MSLSYHACLYPNFATCTQVDVDKSYASLNIGKDAATVEAKYTASRTSSSANTYDKQCAEIDYINSVYSSREGRLYSNTRTDHLNRRSPDYMGSVHDEALREANAMKEQTTALLFIGVVLFLFLLVVAILLSSQRV
jgi:hypothetical protein